MYRYPAATVLRSQQWGCAYQSTGGAGGAVAVVAGRNTTRLSASTVECPRRHFSFSTRVSLSNLPPPPPQTGTMASEERVSQWCQRLWGLVHKSTGGVASSYLISQVHLAADRAAAAAAAPLSSPTSPTLTTPPKAYGAGELTGAEVLSRLRHAIRGDQGRIRSDIVKSVWATFDILVPPAVQESVTADNVPTTTEDNYFMFISVLSELNFDLDLVMKASMQLTAKVDAYTTLLRQAETQETEQAASAGVSGAAGSAVDKYELAEKLIKAKSEVMRCCFEARSAGSPLYYAWLWHTAAMSDGLQRLIHFRKLTSVFERLCKQNIRRLMREQQRLRSSSEPVTGKPVVPLSAAAAAAVAATGASERNRCAGELSKWRGRLLEVGLIDGALSLLFQDFFSKEYLVMEELTWFTTPPSMLDKIMRAERVHPFVRGFDDMRYRMQPAHHRHMFAFLHPAVVEEPLIAVQVALTHGIASSVDKILGRPTPLSDPANTSRAALAFRDGLSSSAVADGAGMSDDGNVNTAIFYSINSAQSALSGMNMGNRLIKRVVQEVEGNINASRQARGLTPIHTFSTLSPIPLYVRWLAGKVDALAASMATATAARKMVSGLFGEQLCAEEEETRYLAPLREAVVGYALRHPDVLPVKSSLVVPALSAGDSDNYAARDIAVLQYLVGLLRHDDGPSSSSIACDDSRATFATGSTPAHRQSQPWWMDHAFTMALEAPLLRSVATYLCTAKRGRGGRIRDPVGNFHVSNGATVYRLNFLSNTTPQASRESACVTVNYWYDLHAVSANAMQYEVSQTVSLGEPIKALLEGMR
ncbi:hypothetical protein JKF63_06440 [Porcisia hertigi]|uniref:Malonyl-CoA decarboxylase C-terminal domain-containing protein n=1 Tax=Porcisia hertigi TaxID=2761500 RepID=A0A836LJX7_9TRYP|nr:hypothetical protein JKF63_06440 [Porcisia hertigi]